MIKIIGINGPIGVGKTTLINKFNRISKDSTFKVYNIKVAAHPVLTSPLIELFYKDKEKYNSIFQSKFLLDRVESVLSTIETITNNLNNHNKLYIVLVDRTIYDDKIFAKYNSNDEEFAEYQKYWKIANELLEPYDITYYRLIDNLDEIDKRVVERGRNMEKNNYEYVHNVNVLLNEEDGVSHIIDLTKDNPLKIIIDDILTNYALPEMSKKIKEVYEKSIDLLEDSYYYPNSPC